MTAGIGELEAWLVTGSQHLYGEAVVRQVDEDARRIATGLGASADVPIRIVARPAG